MSGTTGVEINDKCIAEFNDFKLKKKHRFIIFRVSDDLKSVVIEKTAEISKTYSDFIKELPKDDCRYAVFNFQYDQGAEGQRSKVIFLLWAPEGSKIKHKMVYAGTKDALKKALEGLQIEIQGTDLSEISEEEVLAKCKQISR
eukprot:TRINITY_DN2475_c0_g1_i1.p1 TRINITY_DN2475_c0_g1~~TRINITY_DN2475_c0_g1_i1.p1  ORF type:complete len:162 (-),score=34.67 TRINITY_DN2475_c0_g1_i1:46-474(-)